jgi:GntR family histidine utilization transcriptional repressor
MTRPARLSWQAVQAEVRRRIHAREWVPGDLIPNEVDLAAEFGCARATVNRALRDLAASGVLERRRKAGTRVAAQPVAKAVLDIAVIRTEIEGRGLRHGYRRIDHDLSVPPADVSAMMKTPADRPLLHVRALHLGDDTPYVFEDRWIDPTVVPDAATESFATISANEWLLLHAPYTHGEIAFSATSASPEDAAVLRCAEHSALFTIDRLTWDGPVAVTQVRLLFRPGHQMHTRL